MDAFGFPEDDEEVYEDEDTVNSNERGEDDHETLLEEYEAVVNLENRRSSPTMKPTALDEENIEDFDTPQTISQNSQRQGLTLG